MNPQPTPREIPSEPGPSRGVHPARELGYMRADATMTLREGLTEYYAQIDDLITEENTSPEVAALFRLHDTTHVVFGCDTSLRGEALADTWSIFGSDVTLATYRRYFELQETKDIFASMTAWEMVKAVAETFALMPRAFWRTRQMTKKWPFEDHEAWLDRPLVEVREAFGIRVIER